MRKLTFTAAFVAALAGMTAWSHSSQAQEFTFKPYIGIDLMRMSVDYNDNYNAGGGIFLDGNALLEDSLNGLNIHIGNRFHKNFGAELGYFRTREEEDKDIAAGATVGPGVVAAAPFSTSVKVSGFTLDGLGYLPLSDSGQFELIGTAGVSWMTGEIEATVPGAGSGDADESEFGFRVGGGAQVNLTDKFSLRGLVRYQTADFDGVADNAWIYSAGLNFNF